MSCPHGYENCVSCVWTNEDILAALKMGTEGGHYTREDLNAMHGVLGQRIMVETDQIVLKMLKAELWGIVWSKRDQ